MNGSCLAIGCTNKGMKETKDKILSNTGENRREDLVSRGQTSFLALGVIACSISAQPKKGVVRFA